VDLLDTSEAARIVRCSRATLYRLLPLLPVGGVVRRPSRGTGKAGPRSRILIHRWALDRLVVPLSGRVASAAKVANVFVKYGVA
jgi:hypothetical protein